MDISSDHIAAKALPIHEVVSSLKETILSQRQNNSSEPTPTEYFAAIIAVLRGGHIEHLEAFLQVLVTVISKTNHGVIQSQFTFLSGIVIDFMQEYPSDEYILRNLIDILGSCCTSTEASDGFWSKTNALRVVNALFAFIDDERSNLRRVSGQQLKALLSVHKLKGCRSCRSYASDFCYEVLKTCTRSNYKRSLYVVIFLETSLPALLDADIMKLCHQLITILECDQPLLSSAVFRALDCLLQATDLALTKDSISTILKILLQQQGKTVDMQANAFFYSALCSGVLCFYKKYPSALSFPMLSDFVNCFLYGCETDITEIHCAVGNALKRILNEYIATPAAVLRSTSASSDISDELFKKISFFAEHLTILLSPRFQNSWLYIMDSVRFYFERLNICLSVQQRSNILFCREITLLVKGISGVLNMISTGMLKVSPGADSALEVALCCAMASLGGPTNLIKLLMPVELQILEVGNELSPHHKGEFVNCFERNKNWLLRFLRKYMKSISCSLDDFALTVLPIIEFLKTHRHSNSSETIQLVEDFWSLFPEFCASRDSRDIGTAFPKVIGTLSSYIEGYSLARRSGSTKGVSTVGLCPIFLGMTNIAKVVLSKSNESQLFVESPSSEPFVLSGYAQTILPVLIGFLETAELNDKLFRSAVTCLEVWSGLSPPNLLGSVSKKVLQLLLMTSSSNPSTSVDNDGVIAAKYMSIILAVIPKLSSAMVQLLYRTVKPLLSVNEAVTIQKRSYLVLRALFADRSRDIFEKETPKAVLSVLVESFLLCHVSARSMRLECMELIVRAIDNNIFTDNDNETSSFTEVCHLILGEVLISQKDSNGN